ncbi:hypothetical protein ABPG77_008384 [Micractinium sp. CCAP 211/92]
MVRIVDGEILQDDDPRLAGGPARRPAAAAGASRGNIGNTSGPPSQLRRSVFDWNAPPLRVVPDTDGTSLGGLPGLRVFGALVPAQQLLMLAGLLLIFGWKGAVAGGLLWCWVQQQQLAGAGGEAAQPAAGGNQQARLAAAQDYFQSMFNQAPLGRGGAAGRPAGGAAASGAAEQPAAAADPWAARGRPRRLTDQQ